MPKIVEISLIESNFNSFSIINLAFVLEHIQDPTNLLEYIHKELLIDKGIICISVPNDFNSFQESAVIEHDIPKWWISIPDHINYFDFKSLEQLLNKTGFKTILKETSFPIEMFLLFGEVYIGNPDIGKKCHQKRINFENALIKSGKKELLDNLYKAYAELGNWKRSYSLCH